MKSYILLLLTFGLLASGCNPYRPPNEAKREEYERDLCLNAVSKHLTKTLHLKLLSESRGDITGDKEAHWGISLMSRDAHTLEEVRPLVAAVVSSYIDAMMKNPLFRTHWYDSVIFWGPPKAFGPQAIAIKLSFWDPYFDRYFYPYIAEVRFVYGKVNYYYADPETQKLMSPITETLEELFSTIYQEEQHCL